MIVSFALWSLFVALPLGLVDIPVAPGDSLQAAIELAAPGDRLLVQAGTYVEQIDLLGKAIQIIGVAGASQTVLDGGGKAPVVRCVNAEGADTRLSGLTITNGSSSFGPGGLAVSAGATPTIEDCIIRGNHGRWGGGVSGSPILRRCVIRENTSSLTPGGGVYGAPLMEHCVVANNTATSADGGGVYLTSAATLEDCVFTGNRAVFANSSGGGIYVGTSAPVTIRRSLIIGNSATGGVFLGRGGGLVAGSGTVIERCTIVGNSLSGANVSGGAVSGPASISNTIVWGNTNPQLGGGATAVFSDVEGGLPGAGNIAQDPRLVDEPGGDYHLMADSPCIDSGDPLQVDPDGSRADMGSAPFAKLYLGANTQPADWSDPTWPELSAEAGAARATLRLLAGASHASRSYLVLASLSGSSPGIDLPSGAHLPLVFDGLTELVLGNLNSTVFVDFLGTLDVDGRAVAVLDSGVALGPVAVGLDIDLAWLLLTPKDVTSNAVTLSIVP